MVPLSKFVNFMAFGLKHEPNTIAGKLLHDTQVTYKARGPLVYVNIILFFRQNKNKEIQIRKHILDYWYKVQLIIIQNSYLPFSFAFAHLPLSIS